MNRLLQELTPANVLSWPVAVVTTVWIMPMHFFDPGLEPGHAVATRLAILLALQVLMFAVLALGCLALRGVQGTWAPVSLILLIATAASIRGASLDLILVHLGISDHSQLAYRALAAAFNLTLVYVFTAIAVGEIRRHRAFRARLLADRQVLVEATARAQEQMRIVDAELVSAIQDELTSAISPMSNGDAGSALGALRMAIEDVARPISHDLQAKSQSWMPAAMPRPDVRLEWVDALRDAFRVGEIQPLLTAIAGTLLFIPQSVNYLGLTVTLVAAPALFVAVLVALTIARAVGRVVERHLPVALRNALFFVVLLATGVVLGLLTIPAFASTAHPRAYVTMFPTFLLLVAVVFAFAKAAQARAASVELELELIDADLRWSLVRAREAERQRKHALAFVLHGRVQAALSAAYIRIGTLATRGELDQAALAEMRRDVDAAVDALAAQMADPAPFSEIVDKTRATWQDIADITFVANSEVLSRVAEDPIARSTLNDLIPELCFNAIKHGVASRIQISLSMFDERTLRLTVANDGGPLREGAGSGTGLGNELLEQGTLRWHRRSRGGMTETDALIPVL